MWWLLASMAWANGLKTTCATFTGNTAIAYESPVVIADRERKAAAVAFREADVSGIPPNGAVAIRIDRGSLDAADLRWFEVVVQRDGEIVYRRDPAPDLPQVPGGSPGGPAWWWNTMWIPLPDGPGPFVVWVVDHAQTTRCGASVDPMAGRVKKVKE